MKLVEFTLHADSKPQLIDLTIKLRSLCGTANLDLREGRYLSSLREYPSCNGGIKYDYILQIVKNKEHTYNEIYKLVNSVKVSRFKIVTQ